MTTHTADTYAGPRGAGLAATKPNRALSTTTLLLAATLAIVLIGALLILATPSSTTSHRVGHGATVERNAAPHTAVASDGGTRVWRETLDGRALGAGRAPASALLRPTATGA